jgi:hypothetical protein
MLHIILLTVVGVAIVVGYGLITGWNGEGKMPWPLIVIIVVVIGLLSLL